MSDKNIEIWKIKKLIKAVEAARGNGNSMISLIMPPGDEISRVTKMLGDKFQTASNIKGESVLGAITSAQQRLKLYNEVPPNGLVLYTGTIVTYDGKEKKFRIDFEPFEPINASLYLLDNKFHTEALKEWLESVDKFGFIVMDGNETLFGTLSCNNTRKVEHKFTADLAHPDTPMRYVRLIVRKREDYARKAAQLATHLFINPATSQPNVSGLTLAGPDYINYKAMLSQPEMLDPRLQAKIMNVVDVSYGRENGFNQAIEFSSDILGNLKLIQEKHLIGKVLEEISQDTGKYVFGVDDTLKCLEMGAVEILIVWENLDINRYVLKNSTTGEITIKHSNKEQEADHSNFRDAETNAELEVEENMSLLEWFANEYKTFGCPVEFVTKSIQDTALFLGMNESNVANYVMQQGSNVDTVMEDLHCVLLSRILVRFAARDLAGLRRVSRTWNALLCSPDFVNYHFNHSIDNHDKYILVFYERLHPLGHKYQTNFPILEPPEEINLPVDNPDANASSGEVIGSINGLVCFKDNGSIYIWNPSLGAKRILPPCPVPSTKRRTHNFVRFGYNPETDDYKVISITGVFHTIRRSIIASWLPIQVFNLRRGFWESIEENMPPDIMWLSDLDHLSVDGHDGYIHWSGQFRSLNSHVSLRRVVDPDMVSDTIVAFNLATNTFRLMPLPEGNTCVILHSFGVVNRKLFVARELLNVGYDVWVMDEYGVPESWVKHPSFPDTIPSGTPFGFNSHGVCIQEDDDRCFGEYDPVADIFRVYGRMEDEIFWISKIMEYRDSLIWIPAPRQI